MSEELAIEILKQATLETTVGACEKCPRKDKNKTCIGCLDKAKENILNQLQQKEKEIQNLKQKNDYLNDLEASAVEYKELQKQLQQKENIIKKSREYVELKLWNYFDERNIYLKVRDDFLDILDKENKQ